MDKKDIKILKELLINSREALTQIGKKVGLSRENVYYRIQNLIKKGIVKDFVTHINYTRLGFSHHTLFLQLDKMNEESEKKIIKYLNSKKEVSWGGLLTGRWSITFDIYVKNFQALDDFVNEILNTLKEHIKDYRVLQVIESDYFFNKLIEASKTPKKLERNTLINLNSKDVLILKKLNQNAKISYVELSKDLNLTSNAINKRIKRLEREGIIENYTISINHKVFGYEWNGIQIKLKQPSKDIELKLKNYFKSQPKIIFFYQYLKSGVYDFDIGIITKNSSELRKVINELRTLFYNQLQILDSFLILEEFSSYKLPEILFD